MSSNTYIYTYQHTCRKGHSAYILQNAPFKAVIKRDHSGKKFVPFLGEGYYLWEENLDAAEYWGSRNYKSNHSIVEFVDCKIKQSDLLDFLNRRDIKYFNELKEIYINRREECRKWNLGVWIEFFKKMHSQEQERFPFYFFRAKEEICESELTKYKIKMNKIKLSSEGYQVDLNPYIMICIIDKSSFLYKESRLAG